MRARFVHNRVGFLTLLGALALVFLTALTGNGDAVDPAVIQDNAVVPVCISAPSATTQSFVARRDRLHALQVRWIVPEDFHPAPNGIVRLYLRERPDGPDLATSSLSLSELHNNEFGKFVFAPIRNSNGRIFYFSLEIPSDQVERGAVAVWASEDDAYADGRLYVDGLAAGGDLVMRAYYEPDAAMLFADLARAVERYGGGLLLLLLLCGLIGLALSPQPATPSMTRFILTGLAALSGLGVLFLLLPLGSTVLVLAALILTVLGAIRFLRVRPIEWPPTREALLWMLLTLIALAVGLEQVRDTGVPLWVDSITHAQLVRLLLEQGQLPASSFYHLGFHTVTALVARVSGLTVPAAMLLMAPFLIAVCGLGVGLLCRRLTGSPVAALTSAICIWFLSPTPSYFITWGRYPLLLGVALLPAALVAFMDWVESEQPNALSALSAIVLLGGLAFAHVRLVIFYLAFVAVYLAAARLSRSSAPRVRWSRLVPPLFAGAGFAVLWVGAVLLRGLSFSALVAENTIVPAIDASTAGAVSLTHHGPELIGIAGLAAVVGLLRRSRVTFLVLVWYVLVALIALVPRLDAIGSLITPDLVVLVAFLPVALVIGDATGWLWSRWIERGTRLGRVAWQVAAALIVLLGARDMISVVNPATVSYSDADGRAFEWIRTQTPAATPVLVNSFNWYASAFVPSDGGAWIPFLTGRPTAFLDARDAAIAAHADALAGWMQARNIGYVYIGWKGGILTRTEFECSNRFTLVYSQDGVAIFQLTPNGNTLTPDSTPPDCSLRG